MNSRGESQKSGDLELREHPLILLKKALKAEIELGNDEIILTDIPNANRTEIISEQLEKTEPTMDRTLFLEQPKAPVETSVYNSIADHNKKICNCQKCSLGATRTKFVYGVGNENADVMFIGEAPGANEDLQGEPFVGRSGELLDKILAAIQFKRSDVYIANILKCRPPGNRDPQPDEMELCFPYLKEQIRLIKPRLLCALGRVAAQAVLQTDTPLGKLRGKWHSFENTPLIVTYHPAALLRFAGYKRDTWEDMKELKAQYDALK